MAQIVLTIATGTYGCTQKLKDGTVQPAGFGLRFEDVPTMPQAFRRMVRSVEFDVCEMAITTYLVARAHGKPFTALPVFPVRAFHHGAITRSAAAPAPAPEDLAGRRVGVNRGYTVTTGVWARGILADEYGLDLGDVTWVLSGDEHVAEFQPPPNVVPVEDGKDVPEMVASGELAAGVGIPATHPGVAPLIPDAEEAGYRALRSRGLYPVNHLVVVRDELLAEHPGLAAALFDAYADAKNLYTAALRVGAITDPGPVDRMYQRVAEITGADPLPYGIAPNRPMIDQIIRHAVEQRILAGPVAAEDLFAEATLDLTA
jgi:4,5-dihydroxyphthalate decarboxylase